MSHKHKQDPGQSKKDAQSQNNLRRIRAIIADLLKDDGVPEDLLEQPEVLDEPVPPQEEETDYVDIYGITQDEDWEGVEPVAPKLRPSLEFFVVEGKLRFVVKGDASRMYKENQKDAQHRLHKLRLIGKVLTKEYETFLLGAMTELKPTLSQQKFVREYAEGAISASVLSNLLSRRSVELPDGRILPLRSFFSKAHGIKGIPPEDAELRIKFAKPYLVSNPNAEPAAIMHAYIEAGTHTQESTQPDGNDTDYQGSLRKWFERNVTKPRKPVAKD